MSSHSDLSRTCVTKENTQKNKCLCLTGPDRHFLLFDFLVFGDEQAAHQNASPVLVRLRWKQHLRLKCLEKQRAKIVSEFMISVNSRARGERHKEHCGCAVSGKPGQASGTFTMVSPKKPRTPGSCTSTVLWAAVESVPSGRKRNSHKQATSSPTSPAPQTGLMACFSHDRLAP